MVMVVLVMFIGPMSFRLRSWVILDILRRAWSTLISRPFLGKEALETLGGHLNFCERVLTLESLGTGTTLEMSPVGHYPLNMVDFPESIGAGKPDPRNGGSVKRVVNNKGMVRMYAFSSWMSPR